MNLLLLSTTTGYQARSFGEAARALGMRVVFGTDRCHVLEDPWQDAALPLRFEDPADSAQRIADRALQEPIAAVVAVGDKPALTAALACRKLGLPWHPPSAAEACHDKVRARGLFRQAGLNVPEFHAISIRDGAEAALRYARLPCVLKPASLSGSRGVIRVDTPRQLADAFQRIAALLNSPDVQVRKDATTETVLVEEFIPGREFAVEAVMERGCLKVLAIFEKPDPLDGPFFEETIYVTPPRLEAEERGRLLDCLARAVGVLGLFHGPLHAEFRANNLGVWPLEIAARPIGGLCSRALRFDVLGRAEKMPLEELLVRNGLGLPLDGIEREGAASAVMMVPIPAAGVYQGVDGVEEARAIPGVEEIRITAKPGEKLVPWPEGASYPGFIFARAETSAGAEGAVRQAHQRLRFRIQHALAVV